jgi:hypothetical protein
MHKLYITNLHTKTKRDHKKKTNIRRLQTIFALKHELSVAGKNGEKSNKKKKNNVQPTVLVLLLLLPPAGS